MKYIGQPLPRREDPRLLAGAGRYTDDIVVPGQAACAFVRSPHAHARFGVIDAQAALAMPGVVAVLTGADYRADGHGPIEHAANPLDVLDVKKRAFAAPPGGEIRETPHWPLPVDRVRYVGEPVALVIAESAAQARDAAEHVTVDYTPLRAVTTAGAAAAPDAPLVHDGVAGNALFRVALGDREATARGMAAAAVVVHDHTVHQRIVNCQMEPRSAIGEFDAASARYTLTTGSQGVSRLQTVLAAALRVTMDEVRVVTPDVGGGFGPRSFLYVEQLLVAWAARRVGRPVKWTSDRSEAFLSDYGGRDAESTAALALDRDGRILAYDLEVLGNAGAHAVAYVSLSNIRNVVNTVYDVPAVHLRLAALLTHTVPTAPFRGAGRPEAMHVMETLLDRGARALGLDRVEIRRRNLIRRDQMPYRNPMGVPYDSADFRGYMERVLVAADWVGFAARRTAAKARGRIAGIGVANYVETPVGAPRERAEVTLAADGSVDVVVGTHTTGQGHETSFAQVLADQLGVAIEAIHLRYGDTSFVKAGGGTHSDRSMRLAGTLLVQAAGEIVEKGKAIAARKLEVAAADLVFDAGVYRIAGTDRKVTLGEVARIAAVDMREALAAVGDFVGRMPAYPGGSAVCEIEIDPETAGVTVTRYTTVDDVGRPINPLILDGQTHGGIAQGVSQALHEGALFDASGQLVTGSFMDYGIVRADALPAFACELMEEPTQANPLRVKGGGEAGIVPATACVLNALADALASVPGADPGVLAMPVTPARLWRALNPQKAPR